MIHEKALEAVHAGAELLDRLDPEWYRYVDERCLDITTERRCILGQRYGTFELGCAVMNLNMEGAIAHGFATDPDQTDYDARMLEETWGLEIRARRALDAIVVELDARMASGPPRGSGRRAEDTKLITA